MNDRIELMRVFTKVVDAGSFSGAARLLRLTQPQVSKAIAALEVHLGVRLFERTTRSLSLTDEGSQLHRHVGEAITAVEVAEGSIGKRAEPSGS